MLSKISKVLFVCLESLPDQIMLHEVLGTLSTPAVPNLHDAVGKV